MLHCCHPIAQIGSSQWTKDFLCKEFNNWYSKQVCSQFQEKSEKSPIDTTASVVKPLGAEWMKALFDYFKGKPEIICNGFKEIKAYLDD